MARAVGMQVAGALLLAALVPIGARTAAAASPAFTPTQKTLLQLGIQAPISLAVDGAGDVYAANYDSLTVNELTAGGVQTAVPFTGSGHPTFVASDPAGDVFETTTSPPQVIERTAAGVQSTIALTGLSGAGELAADASGNLFVIDIGNERVLEMTASGVQSTLGFTGLGQPEGLGVDAAGDVFVGDPSHHRVVELSGGTESVIALPGVVTQFGLGVDAAGDVFVADRSDDAIVEVPHGGSPTTLPVTGPAPVGIMTADAAGDLFMSDVQDDSVLELPTGGSSVTTLPFTTVNEPAQLALDANDDVTVADGQVSWLRGGSLAPVGLTGVAGAGGVAYDAVGDLFATDSSSASVVERPDEGTQVTLGFTGLSSPEGVATNASGTAVYVADTGNNRVVELPMGGTQVTLGFTGLSSPTSVAVDSLGDVLVADSGNNRIVEMRPGGILVTLPFTGLLSPQGITPDDAGDFFVADSGNGRVVELQPNGTQVTLPFVGINGARDVRLDGHGDAFVAGDGWAGAVVELTYAAPPTKPGLVSANPGNGSATVSWLASSTNGSPVQDYVVTPLIGGNPADPGTASVTTGTSVTVPNLTNGTSYTFVVRAASAVGFSPTSLPSTPIVVGAPTRPALPTAVAGNGAATVRWYAAAANGSPVTAYSVTPVVGTKAGTPQVFPSTATTQVVTGLQNGTTYSFRVSAVNALGTGPYSATSTVEVGTPTPPGLPSAQPGNGAATVSWFASTANASAITKYVITPVAGTTVGAPVTIAAPATSGTVPGLTNGTAYTFRVSAVNATGTGAYSTTATVIVGTPTRPPFPSAQALVASAKVSWHAAAPNGSSITGYVVTPVLGAAVGTPQTFASSATSGTVTGLVSGKSYVFRVAAVNAHGAGPYSTTASVTIA